jgi:hypothetical protein
MEIIPPRPNVHIYQPMMQAWYIGATATYIPDWPMPANIKDFEEIYLEYTYLPFYNKICGII